MGSDSLSRSRSRTSSSLDLSALQIRSKSFPPACGINLVVACRSLLDERQSTNVRRFSSLFTEGATSRNDFKRQKTESTPSIHASKMTSTPPPDNPKFSKETYFTSPSPQPLTSTPPTGNNLNQRSSNDSRTEERSIAKLRNFSYANNRRDTVTISASPSQEQATRPLVINPLPLTL